MERRPRPRDALGARDLDPAFVVEPREIEQSDEGRLVEPEARIDDAHVVDHVRDRKPREPRAEIRNEARRDIEVDVPPEGRDAFDDPVERGHVGHRTKAGQEREAAARDPGGGKVRKVAVAEGLVHVGDALVASPTLRDGVGDDTVVAAMRRRVDDDGAFDAEPFMQRPEHVERSVWWRVGSLRRIGVQAVRPEDVTMGVAGFRRQAECGTARVGMRRCDGRGAAHAAAPGRSHAALMGDLIRRSRSGRTPDHRVRRDAETNGLFVGFRERDSSLPRRDAAPVTETTSSNPPNKAFDAWRFAPAERGAAGPFVMSRSGRLASTVSRTRRKTDVSPVGSRRGAPP